MVHETKLCFSKNALVIKLIVNGNYTKQPTQSMSEVLELEESQLVEPREIKWKSFNIHTFVNIKFPSILRASTVARNFLHNTALPC